MLEKTPAAFGHLLARVRPGLEALVWARDTVQALDSIAFESEAFADGTPIPARYTADGEGLSPPLAWSGLPPDPPTGHGRHRYVFQVFALDHPIDFIKDDATKHEVIEALEGHVLARGRLVGLYERAG